MHDNNNSAIWEPGEIVYQAGDIPKEAYLILEGYVNIETKDGLKLNRIGMGEIFGETSILLDLPRTVTAKVCTQKLVAKKIPKSYFTNLSKTNVILNALIRKTQIRLMDSNKQSNELANEVSALLDQLDSKTPPKKNLLEERIKKLRTNINKIQNSTET
ncbi:cyclic nucleotide-binding domain-containing protein [Alphaproteobacteria bacterium]|jgi:CRP-like cAMP-binding protein|nr:cyclic nucleotide-binding domain-containing protein [Alphaproteobacteria bacterium]MDB2697190.1 cyclic nucleotide-binding domain-containing protein [Alphaproteobacteria bacterium]MDC3273678.1 cyclic nucleotide-binding domain-containing protein [Alphaproteobacteria bacterium]